jgi:hypothetical protein
MTRSVRIDTSYTLNKCRFSNSMSSFECLSCCNAVASHAMSLGSVSCSCHFFRNPTKSTDGVVSPVIIESVGPYFRHLGPLRPGRHPSASTSCRLPGLLHSTCGGLDSPVQVWAPSSTQMRLPPIWGSIKRIAFPTS